MNSDRLEILKKFVTEDPNDPFNHYALALEYAGKKDYERAIGSFTGAIKLDPGYIPAYHQVGILYKELGKIQEARKTLKEGIERAKASSDTHAASEMQDVLAELDGETTG
jgi:tetratricopeptide (TPR) repeat protein